MNSEQQQQQPSAFVPTHLRGSAKVLVEHRGGLDAGLITEDPEPLADDEVFAPDVPDSDDDDVVAEIDSSLARRAGSELSGGLAAGAAPRITRPTSQLSSQLPIQPLQPQEPVYLGPNDVVNDPILQRAS